MKKYLQIDVTGILLKHVMVGDLVQLTMHTHEGSVTMFMPDEDFKRLHRNDFFIEPEIGLQHAGVIATTETFIIE